MQNPSASLTGSAYRSTPVFTKGLQNIKATKGQLVVFECRICATPTLQVHWYREYDQIIDSADFRILRKKACSSAVPEEVCTLVITEAFPEDSGIFKCVAENEFGSAASSARLSVSPGAKELESFAGAAHRPAVQVTMKKPTFPRTSQTGAKDRDAAGLPSYSTETPGLGSRAEATNFGQMNSKSEAEDFHRAYENSPQASPLRENPHQESLYSAKQGFHSIQEPSQESFCGLPPIFYQPPIQSQLSPTKTQDSRETSPMSVPNFPSVSSMCQPTMFNYERPKHFIQSKNVCQGQQQPPGPTASTESSRQIKQSSILIQPRNPSGQKFSSSSSLSSSITLSSPSCSAPKESIYPVTPASAQSPASSSSGQRLISMPNQPPAAFLCSVLPSQPDYNSQTPSPMEPHYSQPMYNKQASINSMQKTSDQEIRGTKEALIQDLEKKLRCKDNLLQNGNQRLTYEERMARRLLGPVNAASVLEAQSEDNMQNAQHQNAENIRLQVPTTHVRSRPSSRGDERGHDSIQEKFFQPRFTQVPEDVIIEEGRFCRLDFKVSGLPTPDVMWYQNGRMVHQDQFHKMIVSEKGFHSFIFEAVKSSDAGTYECVAVNRAGESSFAVKVEVIAKEHHTPPTFIFKPQSKKVFEGDTARLECQISAIPTPRIYWKRNNEMVQYNTDRISLLHDNTGRICLLIHNANKKDAGWYTVSAVNGAGVATCHARLEVATHANKPVPVPKQLRVRPTFSKYLALNGRGLDVKQAFSPEGEFQRLAEQSGLYESDEL
ncbi:myotilin isoform X2 [Mycteria americana]